MVGKGHIYSALTTWSLGSQGMPRSISRENVSMHLTSWSIFIQVFSLTGLIQDVAVRERLRGGSTCISVKPSISYVSDKLSKHHGL